MINDFKQWWNGHSKFRTLVFAVIIANIVLGFIIYAYTSGAKEPYYMLWTSPNILLNYFITIVASIIIAYFLDRTHGHLNYFSAFAQGALTFTLTSYMVYYVIGGQANLDLISSLHYIPFYFGNIPSILGYSLVQGGVFYTLVYEYLTLIGKIQ